MATSDLYSNFGLGRDEVLYEQVQIWPISLILNERAGITLWGNGGVADGIDHLLTSSEGLILLRDSSALRTFVVNDTVSKMSTLPGYRRLAQYVDLMGVGLHPYEVFDYSQMLSTLKGRRDAWNSDLLATLLNAMNMLTDAARSLDDKRITRLLADASVVQLLERITFVAEQEISEVAVMASDSNLIEIFEKAVSGVEEQVVQGSIAT